MERTCQYLVTKYDPNQEEAVAWLWRRSKRHALGDYDEPHTLEEMRSYLANVIVRTQEVRLVVARDTGRVAGFLAVHEGVVTQLYVCADQQGRGVGSHLIEEAKRISDGRLRLFTFEKNSQARKFYEKHGFVVIGHVDTENEERLPALQYEWRS